jgi:catechol 2,3-dioxygenase-like lactoylglutathione lyase family enzyme
MQGLTGFSHLAIRTLDVDRTLDFYVGKLGFTEMFRLTHDDGRVRLIFLRLTDDQFLEIFPEAVGDRPPNEGLGLNHYCLGVDDIEAFVDRLAAAGVALDRPIKTATIGDRHAFFSDPDGNRIELMQIMPDGMTAQALRRLRTASS